MIGLDREEMRDWQYREENPGYQRETGLTRSDFEDMDPGFAEHYADYIAAENKKIRASNERTALAEAQDKIDQLTAQLKAHGITPVTEED